MTPVIPTPGDYSRMSWHQRGRTITRLRKLAADTGTAAVEEARHTLARITPDDPEVCAERRAELDRAVSDFVVGRPRRAVA